MFFNDRKKLDAQKAAKSFHDVQALEFTMEDTEEKWSDELEAFKMGDRITSKYFYHFLYAISERYIPIVVLHILPLER